MISKKIQQFRKEVRAFWKRNGRHDLPWRRTNDPYRILVSEVMLQQTQVPRVVEKYGSFLEKFPTVESLAHAKLGDVLKEWNGLGYNRRARYLHEAARTIVKDFSGNVREAFSHRLPGVGPYTNAAVRVFAWNEPRTMIETNIRAAYIHFFFAHKKTIHDRDLIPLIESAAERQDPREWHWALMDYGAHLKRIHHNPTRKSAHYVMQTKFEGSLREIRGAVIKILTTGAHGDLAIAKKLPFDESRIREALHALKRDGLVVGSRGSWRIA